MDDRELLELAAKAAGIELTPCTCSKVMFKAVTRRAYPTHWDPLNDDSDALRLAVRLHMQVSITKGSARAETLPVLGVRVTDNDEFAATRRAIVRAAAEIITQPLAESDFDDGCRAPQDIP